MNAAALQGIRNLQAAHLSGNTKIVAMRDYPGHFELQQLDAARNVVSRTLNLTWATAQELAFALGAK